MKEIILLPSLQRKLQRAKEHASLILKLIRKLEEKGKNALKILDVTGGYLLGEMKVMRPPYRLYIIVDQSSDKYYIAEWEHKQKQEKVIQQLKIKLTQTIQLGLDKIFT